MRFMFQSPLHGVASDCDSYLILFYFCFACLGYARRTLWYGPAIHLDLFRALVWQFADSIIFCMLTLLLFAWWTRDAMCDVVSYCVICVTRTCIECVVLDLLCAFAPCRVGVATGVCVLCGGGGTLVIPARRADQLHWFVPPNMVTRTACGCCWMLAPTRIRETRCVLVSMVLIVGGFVEAADEWFIAWGIEREPGGKTGLNSDFYNWMFHSLLLLCVFSCALFEYIHHF